MRELHTGHGDRTRWRNIESWQAFVADMDEVSDPEIEAKIIKVLIDNGSKLPKEMVGADAADRLSE